MVTRSMSLVVLMRDDFMLDRYWEWYIYPRKRKKEIMGEGTGTTSPLSMIHLYPRYRISCPVFKTTPPILLLQITRGSRALLPKRLYNIKSLRLINPLITYRTHLTEIELVISSQFAG